MPELNEPPSATTECATVSLFIHVTEEPTEILIGFGAYPPLTIVALTVVGVGDVGELLLPHAIAAINNITAKVILIRMDMITSPATRPNCKRTA